MDQGRLPETFYKKRKSESETEKNSRLIEAVNACKNGLMSQATASVTFQIPKTTIWRHLQKEISKNNEDEKFKSPKKSESSKSDSIKNEDLQDRDYETYCGVRQN